MGALSSGYSHLGDSYDEMAASDGALREHWRYVAGSLDDLGAEELARRFRRRRVERRSRHAARGPASGHTELPRHGRCQLG